MITVEVAIIILIAFVVGLVAGYLIGKSRGVGTEVIAPVNNLSTQVAELKSKFEEVEKQRMLIEGEKKKFDEERNRRFEEFMTNFHRLFKELSDKTTKIDQEKDKRIAELTEQMKRFFQEQKESTEKFLIEQGKTREEIEKRRDAQIEDMKRMMEIFTRTVSGTKTRGITGEALLKEVLKDSIRVGLIKTDLKTDEGVVEFAWDLGDGKFIPIDSKLPDLMSLVKELEESDDEAKREEIKKSVINKLKKEISRVQKYNNRSNTIDGSILVVPEVVLDLAPELVSFAERYKVFLCSYKDVFLIAHTLQENYIRTKESGDIGVYREIISSLFRILDKIREKTDAIERGLTIIRNANDAVRSEVQKGKMLEVENNNKEIEEEIQE